MCCHISEDRRETILTGGRKWNPTRMTSWVQGDCWYFCWQVWSIVQLCSTISWENGGDQWLSRQHCEDKDLIETTEDISEAIKYIKSGKSDGDKGLVWNHLLMSCEEVKIQLGKLITAINMHVKLRNVLMRTIATISKDSRDNICSSKNYSGITLCSSKHNWYAVCL